MRVGFLQFRPVFGKVVYNTQRVLDALQTIDADLVVLPELAFTGYAFADRAELQTFAENPQESTCVQKLCELCAARNLSIVTGFAESADDKLYNTALLLDANGVRARYRKTHLFMREHEMFDKGDSDYLVYDVKGARIGMMVCFDWAFPEVARALSLQGADVLCHPSNLVLSHCQAAMLTRCLENGVYAITANRCGADTREHTQIRFTGRSQIAGPRGERLFKAPAQQQTLYVCDIDIERARAKQITPYNHLLGDRRPELYGRLVTVP